MRVAQRLEKPRKGGDVSNQPLAQHFLFLVILRVSAQGALIIRRQVVRGHQTLVQRLQQVEVFQLRKNKRKQLETPSSPAQEVGAAFFQFPGARAAQDETQALVFNEPVHLVHDRGRFLHLVQDDGRSARLRPVRKELFPQQSRIPVEIQRHIRFQEVIEDALGKRLPQISGFACFAGAPQKSRLPSREVNVQDSACGNHSGTGSLIVGLF